MIRSFFLIVVLAVVASAQSTRTPDITRTELYEHVKYLASDALEGRRAGSKGADLAVQYIVREFASYGLTPKGDNGTFLQTFEFVSGVKLGPANSLSIKRNGTTALELNKDFRPLGFSSSESVEGDLVFAGYGISLPNKTYDDFDGIDVKGKILLLLRNAPPSDSTMNFSAIVGSLRYKATKAKELGAKAILFVTGPEDDQNDQFIRLSYDQSTGNAGIVAIHLKREAADRLLKLEERDLADVQKGINAARKPNSFPIRKVVLSIQTDVQPIRETTANAVGFLEGSDPLLKNEVIVIGAHYDHLGFGGEGSGSLSPDTPEIHNGADDNASGTAGLLELAQAFGARKHELKRSILFLAFAAEELGLLGSAHYVAAPTLPLERMAAMLNMDMIGRLNNRTLIVYGIGTSPGFEELVKKHNQDSTFIFKLNKDGFGPSDHASFYGKQIPVFHFFTDIHSDYHRPSDDFEKINAEGMEQVAKLVYAIASDLILAPEKPAYAAVEAQRPAGGGRGGSRVYMGTIPDFGESTEGMKISGVREGSPAAKAGLIGGDVIVKFGRVDIKNLYDFTYALGEYKPGDEVDVTVKRGMETKTMRVLLERRSQ
jgi:hypothetical protein